MKIGHFLFVCSLFLLFSCTPLQQEPIIVEPYPTIIYTPESIIIEKEEEVILEEEEKIGDYDHWPIKPGPVLLYDLYK